MPDWYLNFASRRDSLEDKTSAYDAAIFNLADSNLKKTFSTSFLIWALFLAKFSLASSDLLLLNLYKDLEFPQLTSNNIGYYNGDRGDRDVLIPKNNTETKEYTEMLF